MIRTDKAPAPIGPYSQAILAGNELFCSGQIAIDPATGELSGADAAAQAQRVLKNLGAVLEAAQMSYGNVVKTTIFLVDMNDFASVNEVYAKYFDAAKPARSTIAVAALPKGARVEIEAIAKK
ncbi:MAG TPA: RidA family protein [Candidatus Baltobacteraceae bacterium]|jgi:2-iminobutanoate/2-iminopropanoate deaminase|nr:RidA family protein [Candidatus Baltobacteraceae bacterium]